MTTRTKAPKGLTLKNAFEAIGADGDFLSARGLAVDRRRYTAPTDHPDVRIAAHFEAGKASVTSADKRTTPGLAAPRKQESAETVEDALRIMAQFLADETR